MFTHNFDPILFDLGFIAIRWYSLAYIFGIILGWWYGKKIILKKNEELNQKVNLGDFDDLITYIIIAIILGGRLGYIVFYNLEYFILNPIEILKVWKGGMSFHGALIGIILATIIFSAKRKIRALFFLDIIACVSPIGIFFGRIANFINGELVGKVTNVYWGVIFPKIDNLIRHPSQLYEAILEGLILFFLMIYLAFKKEVLKFPGFLAGVFFIGYGLARCFVELFRQPDAQFQSQSNPLGFFIQIGELGLTMGQILSIPMIFIGFVLCFTSWRNKTA